MSSYYYLQFYFILAQADVVVSLYLSVRLPCSLTSKTELICVNFLQPSTMRQLLQYQRSSTREEARTGIIGFAVAFCRLNCGLTFELTFESFNLTGLLFLKGGVGVLLVLIQRFWSIASSCSKNHWRMAIRKRPEDIRAAPHGPLTNATWLQFKHPANDLPFLTLD